MNSTNRPATALSNHHPNAEQVGAHLVIEESNWVPGKHPDTHRRYEGQTSYLEEYLRCIRCGVEVLRQRDLPDGCEGGGP